MRFCWGWCCDEAGIVDLHKILMSDGTIEEQAQHYWPSLIAESPHGILARLSSENNPSGGGVFSKLVDPSDLSRLWQSGLHINPPNSRASMGALPLPGHSDAYLVAISETASGTDDLLITLDETDGTESLFSSWPYNPPRIFCIRIDGSAVMAFIQKSGTDNYGWSWINNTGSETSYARNYVPGAGAVTGLRVFPYGSSGEYLAAETSRGVRNGVAIYGDEGDYLGRTFHAVNITEFHAADDLLVLGATEDNDEQQILELDYDITLTTENTAAEQTLFREPRSANPTMCPTADGGIWTTRDNGLYHDLYGPAGTVINSAGPPPSGSGFMGQPEAFPGYLISDRVDTPPGTYIFDGTGTHLTTANTYVRSEYASYASSEGWLFFTGFGGISRTCRVYNYATPAASLGSFSVNIAGTGYQIACSILKSSHVYIIPQTDGSSDHVLTKYDLTGSVVASVTLNIGKGSDGQTVYPSMQLIGSQIWVTRGRAGFGSNTTFNLIEIYDLDLNPVDSYKQAGGWGPWTVNLGHNGEVSSPYIYSETVGGVSYLDTTNKVVYGLCLPIGGFPLTDTYRGGCMYADGYFYHLDWLEDDSLDLFRSGTFTNNASPKTYDNGYDEVSGGNPRISSLMIQSDKSAIYCGVEKQLTTDSQGNYFGPFMKIRRSDGVVLWEHADKMALARSGPLEKGDYIYVPSQHAERTIA